MNSCFVNGDVGGDLFDPATGIEIVDPVAGARDGCMRMAAEDTVGKACLRVGQGTFSHFVGESQPPCAQTVQRIRKLLVLGVPTLQMLINANTHAGEKVVFGDEAVKLMAVDGNVPLTVELPDVTLVDGDAR